MLASIIFVAEAIGIIAFAVSGAMLAAEKNLDIFGILVLGIVTAFGGGVIRDLLLGINPPAMFSSYVFLLLAVLASCAVFGVYRLLAVAGDQLPAGLLRFDYHGLVNFFDAIGLGVFSVSGVNVALDGGFADNPLLAITVGVLTGIGGGMVRDLLNGEIPSVLRKNVYALAAIWAQARIICWLIRHCRPLPACCWPARSPLACGWRQPISAGICRGQTLRGKISQKTCKNIRKINGQQPKKMLQ